MLLMRPGAGGGPALCRAFGGMGCPGAAPPARVLDVPPPEDARACKKHHLLDWELGKPIPWSLRPPYERGA